MPRRWTTTEENKYRLELFSLYIEQNKSLREVALALNITEASVFSRLKRLGIKTCPTLKDNYLRKRKDLTIPTEYSADLAEFFGVMLGDGHLSHFQATVTLGNKEKNYAEHVSVLFQKVFGVAGTICVRKSLYRDVYLGSVEVTSWLFKEGLVSNKVKSQVNAPSWIFRESILMENFLRGFFDTDGSVYKLKFGIQISFCNRSLPLLESLHLMLKKLKYHPSNISGFNFYLTRRKEVKRFFEEVRPANSKHVRRYFEIMNASVG
ncbi:MAG TPA: LAGLIDADG family homing endonuclease [Candidatus Paceibacterota bacterium]|nr:LAGLIDADG family homing endonuclease [Candidatus Paceibacterota bacterium]